VSHLRQHRWRLLSYSIITMGYRIVALKFTFMCVRCRKKKNIVIGDAELMERINKIPKEHIKTILDILYNERFEI